MPVRINDTTVSVRASGLADGSYRLVADRARFNSGDQYTAVALDKGEGCAAMYGEIPSSTMGDAMLSLQTIGGTTLCSTNFTVLWVDISMRCGQDEPFSPDNGMAAQSLNPNNAKLGMQKHPGFYTPNENLYSMPTIGNIVEFVGIVRPCDFSDKINFVRDNIAEFSLVVDSVGNILRFINDNNVTRGQEPQGNDRIKLDFSDTDPSPNGRIFDVDTPGFHSEAVGSYPSGWTFVLRMNFAQYTIWGRRRCSDDFLWFTRTTVVRTNSLETLPFVFFTRPDRLDDNSVGEGSTQVDR